VWAYLLLVGGFLFFDDEGTLIQANALTLVPSDHMMKFDGPHAPNRDALQTLRESGRMKAVTLDALESMNFKSFGWVHACEVLNGNQLSIEEGVKYAHGAFVYEMKGSEPNFFQLLEHTAEQLAELTTRREPLKLTVTSTVPHC